MLFAKNTSNQKLIISRHTMFDNPIKLYLVNNLSLQKYQFTQLNTFIDGNYITISDLDFTDYPAGEYMYRIVDENDNLFEIGLLAIEPIEIQSVTAYNTDNEKTIYTQYGK